MPVIHALLHVFMSRNPDCTLCYHVIVIFLNQEKAVFGKGLPTEILLIAHQEQQKFIQYYSTEPDRFHLLPPGINRDILIQNEPDAEDRIRIRNEIGIESGGNLILLVGSGFRTKGVDRAIIAFSGLPSSIRDSSMLLIAGRGKPGSYLTLCKKLGISSSVKFLGVQRDIARLYWCSDLLIHPARTENTGTTLLEAMICGVPVLATANCGFSTHVTNADAGLLCPGPFKQKKLTELLSTMLAPNCKPPWGKNGQKYCQKNRLI